MNWPWMLGSIHVLGLRSRVHALRAVRASVPRGDNDSPLSTERGGAGTELATYDFELDSELIFDTPASLPAASQLPSPVRGY